jgi:transcriptional regulator with XRE-family HTH domain
VPVNVFPRRRVFDGTQLKRLRRSAGLSRDELARLACMPTDSLAKYERNVRTPRADTLGLLSSALACPIDDLFRTVR